MEDKAKFCVVCGRTIPALSRRKKTCCEKCRRRLKNGHAPYLNFEFPPFSDLTEIQKAAQKRGMSYGKYVAMQQQKGTGKDNG